MSASNSDVIAFDEFFEDVIECKKLFQESYKEYKKLFKSDDINMLLSHIDAPKYLLERHERKDLFQLHLSPKSLSILDDIANNIIKSNDLFFFASYGEVIPALRESIYLHVWNKGSFNKKGYSKIISRTLKTVEKQASPLEYCFPFNSVFDTNLPISLGSAKVVDKKSILSHVRKEDITTLKRLEKDNYNSFLVFKVCSCSSSISRKIALSSANLIYGILTLYGYEEKIFNKGVSLNHTPSKDVQTTYIIMSEEYGYSPHIERTFVADVDKFWNSLEENMDNELGKIAKKLIDHSLNPTTKNILVDRLIDSVYWFGDAAKDTNLHSQLFKLVIALERIYTIDTEKNSDITKDFSNRVGNSISLFYGDPEKWRLYAREMYRHRSNVAHGRQSIYKSYNHNLNFDPLRVAQCAIFSACILYKDSLDAKTDENKLRAYFDQIEDEVAKRYG